MPDDVSFTLEQAIAAQRRLRSALGLGEEAFPAAAFVGMISDEIEQLRQAGWSDADVAAVVAEVTGQPIAPADIGRYYAPPEARRRD